ncbi:MAG TPA: thiamine pyrophosphate-dependent enzyme [Bryobacteraceae bacterium]|nr:thiamine pyrophosphate-dependent enzyme [Bryobacteraceae bacterium]
MAVDKELALALYRIMTEIRQLELKLQEVYRSGVMPGFIHLYVGEEAVAAGVCAHLRRSDYVTSTHRGHGHAFAKGIPAREIFAEIWGKATGCCGGRGGSMHIYAPEYGFLGTNGIVAAGIPIGAGAALAASLEGGDRVAVSFFGDGAVNNCAFHEGINLAAAWNLPAVFVCENNMYATEMAFARATRNTDVSTRGPAYGIPGVQVDGNDVLAVYEVAGQAIARARSGGGPTLVECKTYRTVGHHEGDPGTAYRTREEVEAWKKRCPLRTLRDRMIASGLASEQEFQRIDEEAGALVRAAEEFARNSPEPSPETVLEHVFA